MFYTKCERVTPPIQKIANKLLAKWMRPILKRSANYKDKHVETVSYRTQEEYVPPTNIEADPNTLRARIPQKIAPSFSVVPVSQVAVSGDRKSDKYRKLKNTLRSKKK